MAQPLSWLPSLHPLCQDIIGFEVVQERLMSLVASVMDHCESIRGESDVAIEEPRRARPPSKVQDSDWSEHVVNDIKVCSLVNLLTCPNVLTLYFEV